MVTSIAPHELEALSGKEPIDIIDVREPSEWSAGHVPGARLIPLAQLKADPAGAIPRDRVVFVCAKGGRSAQAAQIAERLGRTAVYNLTGGTDAWRLAGLAVVVPSATPPARDPKAPTVADADASELVEPSLDGIVAQNLRLARAARGLSLDELSREAGISRTLLGQIELGRAPASIGVVWKIAQAMGVPFATLLSTLPAPGATVSTREGSKKLLSADGRFSSRALFALGDPDAAEFYELRLAPHSREDAEAHRPGTRENLVVSSGRLELKVGSEVFHLAAGDAINFAADCPHSYSNPSNEECWMYLVMNYSADTRGAR